MEVEGRLGVFGSEGRLGVVEGGRLGVGRRAGEGLDEAELVIIGEEGLGGKVVKRG